MILRRDDEGHRTGTRRLDVLLCGKRDQTLEIGSLKDPEISGSGDTACEGSRAAHLTRRGIARPAYDERNWR